MLHPGELDTGTVRPEIDAAWDEVVDRRVDQTVSGTAPLVDGPTAQGQVRAEIAVCRK